MSIMYTCCDSFLESVKDKSITTAPFSGKVSSAQISTLKAQLYDEEVYFSS